MPSNGPRTLEFDGDQSVARQLNERMTEGMTWGILGCVSAQLDHTFLFEVPLLLADSSRLDFIEQNSRILLPLLALLMIVLLAAGVVHAWKTPEIAGAEKARLKGEIIRTLRSHIGWMTAQEAAERLDIETHTVASLMDEMKRDGVLVSGTIESRIHYRVRGN